MDFDYQYSEEQETFRVEVRAWLEENVPDDMAEPVDRNDLTDEQYAFARDLDSAFGGEGLAVANHARGVRRRGIEPGARGHHR